MAARSGESAGFEDVPPDGLPPDDLPPDDLPPNEEDQILGEEQGGKCVLRLNSFCCKYFC